MADHQKIHPVDVELQPPTAPLMPRDSSKSDKGDLTATEQYPQFRRTIPVTHSKPPKKRRGCCCRCICWTLSLLLLLIILIGATVGILYLVFRPKLPKYSIDRLQIADFTFDNNLNLKAQFDVTITAWNPNKKIGIYYEEGSRLSVWYTNTSLCNGTLPKFYQGHRNTTVLYVPLTGETQIGSYLMTSLSAQQITGMIPLIVRGDVPVRVKFGSLKLRKVRFRFTCNLVVDSLSVSNPISIRSSSCKFRLKL